MKFHRLRKPQNKWEACSWVQKNKNGNCTTYRFQFGKFVYQIASALILQPVDLQCYLYKIQLPCDHSDRQKLQKGPSLSIGIFPGRGTKFKLEVLFEKKQESYKFYNSHIQNV